MSEEVRAPNPWLMLLEARAPWELAATLAAAPWMSQLPAGDGQPVLVFPGLGASDLSTAPLRSFLRNRGYGTYPWRQGFNFDPRQGVLEACRQRLTQLAQRHRQKISLIGWSLGGVYVRELAKEQPDRVRCVITLGSPFAGHPRANRGWRFYQWMSGHSVGDNPRLHEQLRQAPQLPTTSIYSRSDAIVAWQCSVNEEASQTENIELNSSHVGMGMNPLVLYAIADRLGQDPQNWQRFDPRGTRRWFYRVGRRLPMGR
jgi:pimeloyl-ACP methyl ester carboxylesterase